MAWYFLRVSDCETDESLAAFRFKAKAIGRIHSSGKGTEIDPKAGWVVMSIAQNEVPGVRERLAEHGLSERVDHIEPLAKPKDGPSIAKQLGLF